MKALFYGSGWSPGKPRTGLLEDIPEVRENESTEPPHDPEIPFWASLYVLLHFGIILYRL